MHRPARAHREDHVQQKIRTLMIVAGVAVALPAPAQVSFYSGPAFRGELFRVDGTVWNMDRSGFNDRASSAVVERGAWEVCEHARFAGRCIVLVPGSYPSLDDLGFGNRISSVRPAQRAVGAVAAPPAPVPVHEYRRRPGERLYDASVTSVRAVVGPPEQRCWVERERVVDARGEPNVPGAILGGVIGGVLGHQVGAGRGRDVATVGGAVAGAAIGANAGRPAYGRDVQRCRTVDNAARPDYWDVTYVFRGVEHRIQMSAPPGPTITVNGRGEPRA